MKRSINKKIVMNTISIVIVLAVVLVAVMSAFMQVLTKEILTEMLPSTIKTASQSIEGNMHMLADRIFMIGDNDIFTSRDSTEDDKRSILKKATQLDFSVPMTAIFLDRSLFAFISFRLL